MQYIKKETLQQREPNSTYANPFTLLPCQAIPRRIPPRLADVPEHQAITLIFIPRSAPLHLNIGPLQSNISYLHLNNSPLQRNNDRLQANINPLLRSNDRLHSNNEIIQSNIGPAQPNNRG